MCGLYNPRRQSKTGILAMKTLFHFVVLVVIASGCKKLYEPHISSPATGYLVVEGYINSGIGPSTITLTRTTKVRDTVSVLHEQGAQVSIESNTNESFPLMEGVNGLYASDVLHLNPTLKYRLKIITQNGKEYLSDFSQLKYTPPIDSITWQVEHDGVQVYVSTHDGQNSTKYYRWTYSETWEFHSRFLKTMDYITDPVTGQAVGVTKLASPDTTVYKCWKTQTSTNIILGSSEKLTTDRIYLPVRYIQPQTDELTVLYYIHLKQIALSQDAYLFYQRLKKNTEELGTIFDPMPSEISGNVHCVSDPNELVIGYVETSNEQEKELFIRNSELPMIWLSQMPCGELEVKNVPPLDTAVMPTRIGTYGTYNSIATFYAADRYCVNCTLRGTNKRPSFWP
jgi:hypothetical protein